MATGLLVGLDRARINGDGQRRASLDHIMMAILGTDDVVVSLAEGSDMNTVPSS